MNIVKEEEKQCPVCNKPLDAPCEFCNGYECKEDIRINVASGEDAFFIPLGEYYAQCSTKL